MIWLGLLLWLDGNHKLVSLPDWEDEWILEQQSLAGVTRYGNLQ